MGQWVKFAHEIIPVAHRWNIFHNKNSIYWSYLPRKVSDSPVLDTLKIWLDKYLVMSRLCLCQRRLDHMILEVPSNVIFYDYMIFKEKL